jgi:limonene-1,2-epoxide hydrolase
MPTALEIVNGFMTAAAHGDYEIALGYLTDDIVYQNMPFPPVTGKQAVRDTLDTLQAEGAGAEWIVHRELSSGDLVMNERTDRFLLKDGTAMELPIAGVFELRDGKISRWRDYFDLETIMKQMPGATAG